MWLVAKVATSGTSTQPARAGGRVRFNVEAVAEPRLRPAEPHPRGYNGREFDLDESSLLQRTGSHAWLNATAGDRIDYANTRTATVYSSSPASGTACRHRLAPVTAGADGRCRGFYRAESAHHAVAVQPHAVRAIVQHVSHRFNTELYRRRQEEQRDLFTGLLFLQLNPRPSSFSVTLTPQSAPRSSSSRGPTTVFAKVGYAFLF
jgi:hypothetical protein